MNARDTLYTELGVFGEFQPDVPESTARSAFWRLPDTATHVLQQARRRT
jgi:hypothetical protein